LKPSIERHTIHWPTERGQKDTQCIGRQKGDKKTHNTLADRKGTKRHTIHWPTERGQKDTQYIGRQKGDKKTYNSKLTKQFTES
jgi:hypothetical protein